MWQTKTMTNRLEKIPLGAVKLVDCCPGRVGSDPAKFIIDTLWRTKDGGYIMSDNDGLILECKPEDLINDKEFCDWFSCLLSYGSQYYYCYGDKDILELKQELMELIND